MIRLNAKKQIHVLLIVSLLLAIFIAPMAEAGILSRTLSAVRPFASIAAKVAGAVAGATLGSAFFPPLGMIAGAVGGWIVGGIVSDSGTRNLDSLATLGGAVAGAMALASFGPIGYIGGALAGGWLGKTAMKFLKGVDRSTTGGMLLAPAGTSRSFSTQTPSAVSTPPPADIIKTTNVVTVAPAKDEIKEASDNYQKAYQEYITASRNGNPQEVDQTHKEYIKALETYKALTGTNPQN